jgi:hypothetical protein
MKNKTRKLFWVNSLGKCVGLKHFVDYTCLLGMMCNIVGVILMKCSCLMLSKKDRQILTKRKARTLSTLVVVVY